MLTASAGGDVNLSLQASSSVAGSQVTLSPGSISAGGSVYVNGTGAPAGSTFNFGTVTAGGNITYGLYLDAARSLPWGNTVGSNTTSATGSGVSQGSTVYGRIAPQTTPKPGAYSDTIVVTVGY